MIKMKGLGRGLDALLSAGERSHADEQRKLAAEFYQQALQLAQQQYILKTR